MTGIYACEITSERNLWGEGRLYLLLKTQVGHQGEHLICSFRLSAHLECVSDFKTYENLLLIAHAPGSRSFCANITGRSQGPHCGYNSQSWFLQRTRARRES